MENRLKESFQQSTYKLSHHGDRTVGVLKEALETVDNQMPSDMYGTGTVIEEFQNKMAKILGKETAVFFPSGTMAQQIALRIWADEKGSRKVAYHKLSHLELHEEDGLRELQPLTPILLGEDHCLLTLEELQRLAKPLSCLLIELPQRELGGVLPTFEELQEISTFCRENGIRLHLDGARLWESLPYYDKSPQEICELFDSVYVSFYKGLGGVAGAILAGPKNFSEEAIVWKRRYGGDLVSLYPYVLTADYYYEKRINRMKAYHQAAKQLAERFNQCDGIYTVPKVPMTNMFQVHIEKEKVKATEILSKLQEETTIGFAGALTENPDSCSFELSVGDALEKIPDKELTAAFSVLSEAMM